MDNYVSVVHQMEAFGVVFRAKDLPLKIDLPKRKTFGKGGKFWYWLRTFRPREGGSFVVGVFGSYATGKSEKVDVDWTPLNDAERKRMQAERDAAEAAAEAARRAEAELAALGAGDLWRRARKDGQSPYLVNKGVVGESCRYLGSELLVPLLRYDLPRDQALRGVQRIKPDGFKLFTKGFAKVGCSVRLGEAKPGFIILVCEGYATGLTLRMATGHDLAVFVALDAGNLTYVVQMVRELHPDCRILICADDDYLTRDQVTKQLNNPGRSTARKVAKAVDCCDLVWPVFPSEGRGLKDTDFNDLHKSQGLEAVTRQLEAVLHAIRTYKHG